MKKILLSTLIILGFASVSTKALSSQDSIDCSASAIDFKTKKTEEIILSKVGGIFLDKVGDFQVKVGEDPSGYGTHLEIRSLSLNRIVAASTGFFSETKDYAPLYLLGRTELGSATIFCYARKP